MHPVLFQVPTPWGAIPVYSYGVMLGLSLIAAWYFIVYIGAKKDGLDRELLANTFLATAVTAIVGSRILYVATNLDRFDTFGEMIAMREGGLVAYGGFLGGLLGSWAYLRTKKVPLTAWADIVAPTLGSGLVLTRIGCWLYGCDFGKPLGESAPRALASLGTFPNWQTKLDSAGPKLLCEQTLQGSPAYAWHVQEYDLPAEALHSLPVHPTQLYESLFGVFLFGISLYLLRRRAFRGQVILVVAGLYAIFRFFIEIVRDDPQRGEALGFTTSQLISMAIVPLVAFAYVALERRARLRGETPIPASALAKDR